MFEGLQKLSINVLCARHWFESFVRRATCFLHVKRFGYFLRILKKIVRSYFCFAFSSNKRQLARYLLLPTLHTLLSLSLSLSERNNFTLLRLSNRVRSNISSFCIIRRAKRWKKTRSSRLQIIIFIGSVHCDKHRDPSRRKILISAFRERFTFFDPVTRNMCSSQGNVRLLFELWVH